MAEMNGTYEGISWTDKYLTVSFTVGQGAAKRFRYVKVPMEHLLDAGLTKGLERIEEKRFRDHWAAGQPPLRGL